ncbi:hypothetical protein, partial [Enterobacter hormaechei]|uniref:hypothetical protein n=1 Tax=Enterobacter hormaechei TaxID=158836 RepID=UPI003CC50F07
MVCTSVYWLKHYVCLVEIDLYIGALFLLFLSALFLTAGWLHLQPQWKPSVSWFKNAESRLNHHLSGLFG